MSNSAQTWVGPLPGQDGIIRVNLPAPTTDASFDFPGALRFGQSLEPLLPLDLQQFSRRLGEYSDGDMSVVVAMCCDIAVGDPYPFYVDIDHGAAVPLFPVGPDRLLSEQGEMLTFDDADGLTIAVDDCDAKLARTASPVEEQVTFLVSGSSTVLSGTLLRPHADTATPAMVMAHGAGFHQRDYYRMFAHVLVRAGMSVLIFDRQGFGDSTGEAAPDLHSNAAGIEAAIDFLTERPDITSIGLWGASNGMWTVPLVAARRPDVAFVAGVGSPGVTQVDAEAHRRRATLEQSGVSEATAKLAEQAWRIAFAAGAKGAADAKQTAELGKLLIKLRKDPAIQSFEEPEYARVTPELSPRPPLEGSAADMLKNFVSDPDPTVLYDPAGSYREISCPVLLQFGKRDLNVPAVESAERIRTALAEGGNDAVTIVEYDAGHMLDVIPAEVVGMSYEQASYFMHGFRFVPGALTQLQEWAAQIVAAAKD